MRSLIQITTRTMMKMNNIKSCVNFNCRRRVVKYDGGTFATCLHSYNINPSCQNYSLIYLEDWKIVGNFAKNTDLINIKNMEKVVESIRKRIEDADDGTLFFNNSFPEYDDEYVGKVLSDLVKQGILHRLSRGVYLKAKETKFGLVYPSTDALANAIAERDNAEVLPTGSTALNMLGLSDQVTMNPVFLTSGSARKIRLGNRTITFKGGVPRNFAIKGKVTRLVVQAMKAIGENNFTEEDLEAVGNVLAKYPEKETMAHDLAVMPSWIKKNIIKITRKEKYEQLAEA